MNGADRRQDGVQAAIDALVASGDEVGLQVAVLDHGEPVVDAVAGLAHPTDGTAVTADTLFFAASTGKAVASTLAHALIAQGRVDEHLRLADVWPEFGAHGKEAVTLRHVLLHTAGVPGLPADTTLADLVDWDRMVALVADAVPWWEPGTRFGYHAMTFGFLLGEALRRATGSPLRPLLREVVTGPLGVADDVHFGVPESQLHRVARQVAPPGPPAPGPEPGSPQAGAMPLGILPSADLANRPDVLTADIPSLGTMTAGGVARVLAGLCGHVPGVELVPPGRAAELAAVVVRGRDEVMGFDSTWAHGYAPGDPSGRPSREGSSFGMVGMNGSAAWADLETGLVVAVMRNRFAPGDLTAAARVGAALAGD